jgi:phosphohistidine phosphatase
LRRVEDKGLRTIIARLPDVAKPTQEARPAGRRSQASPSPRLIYLFRHAKSNRGARDLEDFERPLTSRGELDCTSMGRYAAVADIRPDLVVCSAALRARQTVQRVMPSLGDQAVLEYDRSLYLAKPSAIQEQLRRTAPDVKSVMVVGHNPGIQSLAIRLTGSGDEAASARLEKKFPTAAIAILVFRGRSWNDLGTGTCELHSLVGPRDIGRKRKRGESVANQRSG